MTSKLLKAVALASIFAFTAGCNSRIGPDASTDELKGETEKAEIFLGGPMQNRTEIYASALEENESYTADGELIINGDVPNGVGLQIDNGKLQVNGSVGKNVHINVQVPVVSHTETRHYSGWCYGYDFAAGKFKYSYKFNNRCSETKEFIDGLKYNDPSPAVKITGQAGADTQITTYGKIVIGNQQTKNPNQIAPILGK